jgi:hypothetical protein
MEDMDRVDVPVDEDADSLKQQQQQQQGATGNNSGRMFTLKKWNAVAMWSWDVECDTCAICRVQVRVAYPHSFHPDSIRIRIQSGSRALMTKN